MTASEKGFTLMEIMVSMAVMAIVFGTLFRLQSSTIALSESIRFKDRATALAREQMAALSSEDFDPDRLPEPAGSVTDGYTWTWDVISGDDMGHWGDLLSIENAGRLKKLSLSVYSPGRERKLTVDTWRYVDED